MKGGTPAVSPGSHRPSEATIPRRNQAGNRVFQAHPDMKVPSAAPGTSLWHIEDSSAFSSEPSNSNPLAPIGVLPFGPLARIPYVCSVDRPIRDVQPPQLIR